MKISTEEIITKLDNVRSQLQKADEDLKRIGSDYANIAYEWKKTFHDSKGKLLKTTSSVSAAEAKARHNHHELYAKYEMLKIKFENQSKYNKFLSAQGNILQSMLRSRKDSNKHTI